MPEGNEGTPTPNPSEQNSNRDALPEWAREALSKANNEAAKYRIERNDARDQLTKVLEDSAQADNKLKETEAAKAAAALELTKYKALLEAGFPGEDVAEFADRLNGTTDEELKADAKKLHTLFGSKSRSGYDRSQGMGATDNSPLTPQDALAGVIREAFGGLNR